MFLYFYVEIFHFDIEQLFLKVYELYGQRYQLYLHAVLHATDL